MAGKKLSAADFAAKSYDYVIIGGGTAGLVMAARLSENASISVGVIEAGIDRSDDLIVRAPLLHTELYEKPEYDWLYKTLPQVSLLCKAVFVPTHIRTGKTRKSACLATRQGSRRIKFDQF